MIALSKRVKAKKKLRFPALRDKELQEIQSVAVPPSKNSLVISCYND